MNTRIMIVDDNKITTKLLSKLLEAHGYDVIEAYDGTDALQKLDKLSQENKTLDGMIIDLMMPRMDGFELIKRLKASNAYQDIFCIMITAMIDTENQAKALNVKADYFLTKPIQDPLVLRMIEMLSETKRGKAFQNQIYELLDTDQQDSISKTVLKKILDSFSGAKDNE